VNRSNVGPLLLGLVIGLAVGLIYGWVVQPVRLVDTAPGSLRADFQDDYVALIAAAYSATGDLPRAQARLALLPAAANEDHLAALAQARLAAGRPAPEVQALAALAAALSGGNPSPSAVPTRSPAPVTARPTATLTTPRPRPSPLPTATPGAPFRLSEREAVCDDPAPLPRLQVLVFDAAGEGVPNVLVRVVWDAGQDQFFTGLKPELGVGYGDFTIDPDTEYTVQLAESDAIATGIRSEACPDASGSTHPGSWRLTFVQPEAP
jgi:hypothetical protein